MFQKKFDSVTIKGLVWLTGNNWQKRIKKGKADPIQ